MATLNVLQLNPLVASSINGSLSYEEKHLGSLNICSLFLISSDGQCSASVNYSMYNVYLGTRYTAR